MSQTCDICGRMFNYTSILKLHYRSHTGEKPFLCVLCPKSFSHEAHLIVHQRTQHQGETNVFESRNNTFLEESNLKQYIKPHKDERMYKASKMVAKWLSRSDENGLNLSLDNVTPAQEISKNSGISKKKYSRKFDSNQLSQPPVKKKSHLCIICRKSFSSKSNLNVHYRVHTKEKPFVCDICGKAYTRNFNLKLHYRVHKGRNFSCDACGKEFAKSSKLKNHHCKSDK